MLASLLAKSPRGKDLARIGQLVASMPMSSSAKDHRAEKPNTAPRKKNPRPNTPSPTGKSSDRRHFQRKDSQQSGPNSAARSIMEKFFASAPSSLSSPTNNRSTKSPSTTPTISSRFDALRRESKDAAASDTYEPLSRFARNLPSNPLSSSQASSLPAPSSPRSDDNKQSFRTKLPDPNHVTKSTDTPPEDQRKSSQNIVELREMFGLVGSKNASSPSKDLAGDASSSPLSAILQGLRASRRKLNEEQKQASEPETTAKWRTSGAANRAQGGRYGIRRDMEELSRRVEERVRALKGKSVRADRGDKVVEIPSRDLHLVEVSQLFRVSTKELRKRLRAIGELPRGVAEDEDIVLKPEIVEYIGLDLSIQVNKQEKTSTSDEDVLLQRRAAAEQEENLYQTFPPRPPVVTIMGHVDHGKTTLMDALRRRSIGDNTPKSDSKKSKKKKNKDGKSKKTANGDVAGTEAGGITQVISAFQVPLPDAEIGAVTFLDTPGHAAFRSMRQSGSDAADIIVLVVAADDGVSPQTVEIIDFYKSIVQNSNGGISMLVALNKIDKSGVNVDNAKAIVESQLLEHGIVPEGLGSDGEFGPPVPVIPVSGLTGQGLDDLIAALVLQSEVMDLRADKSAGAEGVVMESRVDKGLGVVANCVIRWGSIAKGDIVVSGVQMGKVRILRDTNDKTIKEGVPSQPVRIVGFELPPKAGDPFVCVESEEEAKRMIDYRKASKETEKIVNADGTTDIAQAELQSAGKHLMNSKWRERLESKHGIDTTESESQIRIPVVLRADADGSLVALRDSLVALGENSSHNVVIDPIHTGIGPVTPADIKLAVDSNATVVCFNVKNEAEKEANEESVQVLSSEVIYTILDEAKVVLGAYLPEISKEVIHGRARVGAIFDIDGLNSKVAGLQVLDGTLYRDKISNPARTTKSNEVALYRVIRNGEVVEETRRGLSSTSLKHFKEDISEIGQGKECGLSLANFNSFQEGDEVECWSASLERQVL